MKHPEHHEQKRKKQSQFLEVLKRLARKPSAMIGLCIFIAVILVFVVIAIVIAQMISHLG